MRNDTREGPEVANYAGDFLWAFLFFLLGLVHPFFFVIGLGAGLVAWLSYSRHADRDRARPRGSRRPFVSGTIPGWQSKFFQACESPAEEAFLKQAIKHFDLVPANGVLEGRGLRLTLQAEIERYRVDFLVQDWLIIEVDGAAWHSSTDARRRDEERDRFFDTEGYRTLRLPAKLVFSQPHEAMRRVETHLSLGKPDFEEMHRREMNFGKALRRASEAVASFADSVSQIRDVEEALAPARKTFDTEKMLLGSALRSAESSYALEAKRLADPVWAAHFDATLEEITSLFDEGTGRGSPCALELEKLRPPSIPADSAASREIAAAFEELLLARATFFSEVRTWATDNPFAVPHAVEFMREAGCAHLWFEATGASAYTDTLELDVEDALPANELLLETHYVENPASQVIDRAELNPERAAVFLSGPVNSEFWRELDHLKVHVWNRLRQRLTTDELSLCREQFCEEVRPLLADILDELGITPARRWFFQLERMVADERFASFPPKVD